MMSTENQDEFANILSELETAAQILLAPPNLVTSEQRHAATSVFMDFRKKKSPFQLCKFILETSKVEFVLFESAGLMKEGLIRQWKDLGPNDITLLRSYLMAYVVNNTCLSSYVRERIVQVIAIIVKRQSIDDEGQDRRVLLTETQRFITSGNMQMQMVGCSLLSALLMEYATTVKSSDVGLPWEVHFFLKKQFEVTELKSIFEFCLQALKELITSVSVSIPPENKNLLLRLITLTETILSWAFISINLPKKLISIYESDHNPSLRPGIPWKETILDPSVVKLFFELHVKIRHDPELAHHTLNCLVQLSSLNGIVVAKRDHRVEYLRNYIENFLLMFQKIDTIRPSEALGFSNIIRQLLIVFPRTLLAFLDQKLLEEFSKKIIQLTIHAMKASYQKNNLDDDASVFREAFEHTLEGWISITNDCPSAIQEFKLSSSVEAFNAFIQCNLCAPDGTRGANGEEEDDDEIGDSDDESDRVKFRDILCTIGQLGRKVAEHSLPLLSQLFEDRLSRLHGQIQRIASQGNGSIDKVLGSLYEDIHWIILISGNVLAYYDGGETAIIPIEIMQFSLSKSKDVNVETSMRVLASPGQPVTDVPGYQSTDPIIRLISGIFKYAEVEKRAVEAGLGHLLSPEVSSSIMWALQRISLTYLVLQETFYSEISMSLISAFGQNSEGAAWTMNFLLDKIISNLSALHSEPKIVDETIELLLCLVDEKEKARQVLKCPSLVSLIQLEAQSMNLPPGAKRGLMKALVQIGSTCEDQTSRNAYWSKVLKPLSDRFNEIICRPDIKKVYDDDKIRMSLISIIESFIGVVNGSSVITVQQIFLFLQPVLQQMVELLNIYHNYPNIVELILEFYGQTAHIASFLNQEECKILYQRSIDILRMYTHHNQGKRIYKKEMEEEQFNDVLLLMKLLTSLLSKDFFSLVRGDPGEDTISAADFCLFGLNIIMPLMSLELLKFPSLCGQYFKTITSICKFYPDKICNLNPPELQNNLVASLELGLTTIAGVDCVFSLCCEFIQSICLHIMETNNKEVPIYQSIRPFLKLILDLVLSQQINSDLVPCAGGALYVLSCCYPDTCKELIQFLVDNQKDQSNRERLKKAFHELMENQSMNGKRENRIRFRENFLTFIVDVRGFLLVK